MTEDPPRQAGSPAELGGRETASARIEASADVDRLAAATRRLAKTIAATEQLAQDRAELLRTMDATVGSAGLGGNGYRLISLRDAAQQTGRHPEVLRRWCSDGRLPAIRIGRTWAISNETLSTLLANGTRARPRLTRSDGAG